MSNSRFKWNEFDKLRTADDLMDYMDRQYDHGDYCHYTTLDIINEILEKNRFWISNVSGLNDTMDSKQFENEEHLYYTLCFSTGTNENLPLWYLYSGIDGKGGRIRLTSAAVKSLLNSARFVLHRFIKKGKYDLCESDKISLTKNDYDIWFGDVLYVKSPEKGNVCLKYNTMSNYYISSGEFEKYEQEHKGFIKGVLWYYEKETRILIKLKGRAAQFAKEYNDKYGCVVTLGFDDKFKKRIQVMLAPEFKDKSEVLDGTAYNAIKQHFLDTSLVRESEYKGQIHMKMKK